MERNIFPVIVKALYKTLRSIIFSLTLVAVGLYVLLYSLFSLPFFTNFVKDKLTTELSSLIGGEILIDDLTIYPFSEVKISGLKVIDPHGGQVLEVATIGAGISIWGLISRQRIELTFGEIISLHADILQEEEGGPLNIDYIIKAFKKDDQNKEKTPFEISLRNVVLRKSSLSFRREWMKNRHIGTLDLGNLEITDLAADVSFPKINEKGVEVDLRRLSMQIVDAINIRKLGLKGKFETDGLSIQNFILQFPASQIFIPSLSLDLKNGDMASALKNHHHVLEIDNSYITPADFAFLNPILESFSESLPLALLATGNPDKVTIDNFSFGNSDLLSIGFNGTVENLSDIKNAKGDISAFNLRASETLFRRLSSAIPKIPDRVRHIISALGFLSLKGDFSGAMANSELKGNFEIESDNFLIDVEGELYKEKSQEFNTQGEIDIRNLRLHHLLPSVPLDRINATIVAEGLVSKKNPQGMLSLVLEDFELKGKHYEGLSLNLHKEGADIEGDLMMHNQIGDIDASFYGDIESIEKSVNLNLDLERLDLSEIIDMKDYDGYLISGLLKVEGESHDLNDVYGELSLNDFSFTSPDNSKSLDLKKLSLKGERVDSVNVISLSSDWVDMRAEGNFKIKELSSQVSHLVQNVFPALLPPSHDIHTRYTSEVDFDILVKKNNEVPDFFRLPVRLLVPIDISGNISGSDNSASLSVNIPYLQQGKDKLIYDTKFVASLYGDAGTLDATVQTNLPVKRGDLSLNIDLFGKDNTLTTDVRWINTENPDFKGHLVLDTSFLRNHLTSSPEINLNIKPSVLQMGTADWYLSNSLISYKDKFITIDGLKIHNDDQFVEIEGTASPEYADVVNVSLKDIDVDYVFDMLQIDYVTFGGTATGEVTGRALLSGNPIAETESFIIKDLSYNGARIGDCVTTSRWNNTQKEIEITADISHKGVRRVLGTGGIWLTRDSLCFDISATKVPVDFVQPFMKVFSSHVGGYASGDVKLFGNFHDIDMTGRIFADSVAIKLDYTNTVYSGSDSVILDPGRILIPHFRLYDKFGNSGVMSGELTHRYFHDPSFTFRLSDASNFLCYDTNSEINPDWYGLLFGSGSVLIQGVPGLVDISADMTVSGNSNFTFVLNETEYAQDYRFLTFSDKSKEVAVSRDLTPEDYKDMLRKSMHHDESLSKFALDIRASVTPQVLFTLVMDPAAGDKITARGKGAMQVKYESDDDEMMMYGKYEIEEGNYNFSLQDIILRDFKIKEGSYISFNGNPLAADMDISATYRVNTNLSDLDKSFSTDKDLNRTNVPVDAVLSVTGNMQAPEITFDIELPTLTQDVERKVKSIISTDDMMNRQIIYLLALNRFYTPEYMGATGNGGELAAVASSTISSQLSNMLSQLTDKFSVAPSFRSDKGDFSDIEVDVALSSRLLNNRLLINGNFGYRDRSTSSTTFVGDFDVEYLLSKNGNLRLKAYNHFNDQNYYLREALTTQGLGIVYRRDFDNWFTFLKKRKKEPAHTDSAEGEAEEEQITQPEANGIEN